MHKKNIFTFIVLTLLALPLTSIPATAANLYATQLSCLTTTEYGDDEVYFLVSVSKPDGSAYAYRTTPTGWYNMNPSGKAWIQNVLLWQEPLFPGQRVILTVTILEDDSEAFARSVVVGQQIAQHVSAAMAAAGGVAYPWGQPLVNALNPAVFNNVALLARGIDSDDVAGQFMVEIANNFGMLQTLYRPVAQAVGFNSSPVNGAMDLFGDGSRYRLFMQANP